MCGVDFPGQGSGFDCINECFGEISDALRETDITCEMLQRAQSCHDNNTEACDRANAQQLGFHLHSVQVKQRERNCTVPVVTIATTAPIPPAEVTCPVVPDQIPATPNTVAAADIAPEGTIPTSCQVRGTGPVSHCRYCIHTPSHTMTHEAGYRVDLAEPFENFAENFTSKYPWSLLINYFGPSVNLTIPIDV